MTIDEGSKTASITISPSDASVVIHENVYGHFAEHLGHCIYGGLFVGEASTIPNAAGLREDVIEALAELDVPLLRWPGGCFADEYHWRDGIGPRDSRPVTTNTHWGKVDENNHFGTHEFFDLCERLGCKAYLSGNLGSGSAREMKDWVEYITSPSNSSVAALRRTNGRREPWRLPYFGIGNESWGCGGNMRAEYYADLYRHYATFVKDHGDNHVERIACGANGADYEWTEVLMKQAAAHMDGLSLHWYTLPTASWKHKGSATEFDESEWHSTLKNALRMDELVGKHSEIMDHYDPERRVALCVDEWGSWYDVEPGTNPHFLYQQNTLRDALVAALTLNVFHRHAARVRMANIAQTVNVLQAMILTQGERMLVTPSYHVFAMYKVHQNATLVPLEVDSDEYSFANGTLPALDATASERDGATHLSLVNLDPANAVTTSILPLTGRVSAKLLSAETMNAMNTFEAPEAVAPRAFSDFQRDGETLRVLVPPKAVVVLEAARQ